ncbi:MAG: M50 family metallopeptidase [Chthonomonadales bacterium]|nr:M50 family metallopeptidase [Chthonomonadales bacterium]
MPSSLSPAASARRRALRSRLVRGSLLALATLAACVGGDPVTLARLAAIAATILAVLYACIALHELGHVIGGLLVGFRFECCAVGPLSVSRHGRRLRLSLAAGVPLTGGLARCVPDDDRALRWRKAAMVAAGPIASLTCSALACLLLQRLGYDRSDARDFGAWWRRCPEAVAAAGSLAIFVATTVPSRAAGAHTDGGTLRALLMGGPAADRHCALLAVAAASRRGAPPREWRTEWILRATALRDGSQHEEWACLLACMWAVDRGDAALSRTLAARALAACPAQAPGGPSRARRTWLQAILGEDLSTVPNRSKARHAGRE